MRYLLDEPFACKPLAEKRVFETREDAINHIIEKMTNRSVLSWVILNADMITHSYIWEIQELIQEGDPDYSHVFDGKERLEIEGEKIACFGMKEMFISSAILAVFQVCFVLYDYNNRRVIERRYVNPKLEGFSCG